MSGSHWMMDGDSVGGEEREKERGDWDGGAAQRATTNSRFLSCIVIFIHNSSRPGIIQCGRAWQRQRLRSGVATDPAWLGNACSCSAAGRIKARARADASFRRQQMMSDGGARNGRSPSRRNDGDSPLITRARDGAGE